MKKIALAALAILCLCPTFLTAQQRTLIACDTLIVRHYHKGVPVNTYHVVGHLKDNFVDKLSTLIDGKIPEKKQAGTYLQVLEPMENKDCYELTGFTAYTETGDCLTKGIVVRSSQRNKEMVLSLPGKWYTKTSVKEDEPREKALSLLKRDAKELNHYYPAPEESYNKDWTISKEGICLVNWYKDCTLYRQKEYLSKDIMPYINDYLKTLKVDKSMRGMLRSVRLCYDNDGESFTISSRADLRCRGCIEIVFPHPIKENRLYGMSIPLDSIGFVYGLNWGTIDEPFLFFADPYDTKEFVNWLRENEDTVTGKRTFKPFEK